MYTTCIYCQRDLARNEVIEHFPIGRRLAFDAAKGRLWVVCRSCERWNLTPLEIRWEAIEECERAFRNTRLRLSTDNIGLARVSEGLELVRVGEPQRPEIAAWRYGDQFGRRRRKTILTVGAGVAVLGSLTAGAAAAGIGLGGFGGLYNLPAVIARKRIQARVRTADGRVLAVRGQDLAEVRLETTDSGTRLIVPSRSNRHPESFTAAEAVRVAGILMPRMNRTGGSRGTVRDAVRELEERETASRLLDQLAIRSANPGSLKSRGLARLPVASRLALEMALHEDQERLALEGELAALEAAWRDAEEIAHIADNMFVPETSTAMLSEMRTQNARESSGAADRRPR